jgi:alpha-amylase/alpha-mannosidase (GH57 family)
MTEPPKVAKHVCVHGHFYQPPRENPWLEAIEAEDSAAPDHDWNERIDAECYAANAAARVVDAQGRVEALVNTYEALSFNFGPTLLSWLEDASPETYAAVIEADRRSVASRAGHGNAIAQVYNHVILPLASPRDRETQVRWGIADFVRRFGRAPEGMWLPETAVDTPSLEALAAQGIAFAVLAPRQAQAVRPVGDPTAEWTPVPAEGLDTTQPYRCDLGGGKSIALFFYNGPVAMAVAFEGLLGDGPGFVTRLASAFAAGAERPQLVHVATDGETFGHHHKRGETTLAVAARSAEVALTNYGEFLARCQPTMEVRIAERTSWSCSHGLARWSEADCGCRHAGGSQAWRKTLRDALDWLRDELDPLFERAAGELLDDPWGARDDYIDVVLDRDPARVDAFLDAHARRPLDRADRVAALSLLELQRHRMLMFTSCGWFFDDCAGLEPVQLMKYATRAVELAEEFAGAEGLERRFVEKLAPMKSNDPRAGDGATIFAERVAPAKVDLRRAAAAHAMLSLFEPRPERRLFCYAVQDLDRAEQRVGPARLAAGRVRVESLVTRAAADLSYALVHLGGQDFTCSLRPVTTTAAHDAMRDDLLAAVANGTIADVIRAIDRHFEGPALGLPDLFLEARRALLAHLVEGPAEELEASLVRFVAEHRRLLDAVTAARAPLNGAVGRAVELVLEASVAAELARLADGASATALEATLHRLEELMRETWRRSIRLGADALAGPLSKAIEALVARLAPDWSPAAIGMARRAVGLGRGLNVAPRLRRAQDLAFRSLGEAPPAMPNDELEALLAELGISPGALPRPTTTAEPA